MSTLNEGLDNAIVYCISIMTHGYGHKMPPSYILCRVVARRILGIDIACRTEDFGEGGRNGQRGGRGQCMYTPADTTGENMH